MGREHQSLRWYSLALCCLLLVAVAPASVWAETRDPYQHLFSQTFGDFSEELETARAAGKKGVMIFFEMDECPFCHRMKNTVLNRPEVQAYFTENFLCLAVDVEGDIEIADFKGESMTQKEFALKKNRVRATPVFAFFNLDGERVARYTGATTGIEEFMLLGRYVAEGHYQKQRFTRFKREQRTR